MEIFKPWYRKNYIYILVCDFSLQYSEYTNILLKFISWYEYKKNKNFVIHVLCCLPSMLVYGTREMIITVPLARQSDSGHYRRPGNGRDGHTRSPSSAQKWQSNPNACRKENKRNNRINLQETQTRHKCLFKPTTAQLCKVFKVHITSVKILVEKPIPFKIVQAYDSSNCGKLTQ